MRRPLLLALAGASFLAIALTASFVLRPPDASALSNCDVSHAAVDTTEQLMLDLVAQTRAGAGLGQLVPGPSLSRAAAWQSNALSAPGAPFSHTDGFGRGPYHRMLDCGYNQGVNENIGIGGPNPPSAPTMLANWMNSPGHRAAILNPAYRAIGVGRHGGAWTLTFGCEVESAATSVGAPGLSCLGGGVPAPIAGPTSPSATGSGSTCDASDAAMDVVEQQFLILVNQQRAAAGLVALVSSSTLSRAAAWKAADPSSVFPGATHEPDSLGRSYAQRLRDCDVRGSSGEIIGLGSTPPSMLASFNGSPLHRSAIMAASFRSAGVARHGNTWTIVFSSLVNPDGGSIATASPPPATSTPAPITPTPAPPPPAPQTKWTLVLPLLAGVDP